MFDTAKRRRSSRKQRERGCSVYVPAEILRAAGVDVSGAPPFYRVFVGQRGGIFVRFYKDE